MRAAFVDRGGGGRAGGCIDYQHEAIDMERGLTGGNRLLSIWEGWVNDPHEVINALLT